MNNAALYWAVLVILNFLVGIVSYVLFGSVWYGVLFVSGPYQILSSWYCIRRGWL